MITTMRRMVSLVVMTLVLLAGLFGWTMKMEAAPPFPLHHSGIHANHLQADGPPHYCPPPPFTCIG